MQHTRTRARTRALTYTRTSFNYSDPLEFTLGAIGIRTQLSSVGGTARVYRHMSTD
jgi:hypothetical protein